VGRNDRVPADAAPAGSSTAFTPEAPRSHSSHGTRSTLDHCTCHRNPTHQGPDSEHRSDLGREQRCRELDVLGWQVGDRVSMIPPIGSQ
jgi:hypothetical protein